MRNWSIKKHIIFCSVIFILHIAIWCIIFFLGRADIKNNHAPSIGIIGGADGPTVIFVSSGSFASYYFPIIWLLLFIVVLLLYKPIKRLIEKSNTKSS